jgi:hypothetical protein
MSTVYLIALETGLLMSGMAFAAWVNHAAHRAAMEVYSGVRDGFRLSRSTRRLILIYVYGGRVSIALGVVPFVGLALIQIGGIAASSEASTVAYLFALVLFLAAIYIAVGATMTILSLNRMVMRGLRGEKAL